jgi:hypothetical protein
MDKKKILKFIANWIIRASVWTFFLHTAAAVIYYTHWELYSRTGIQADLWSSVTLVLFMVAGAFFISRPVLERVLIK